MGFSDFVRRIFKRQYAAAKTTRSTGAWSPVNQDVNSLIGMSNAVIKARVRQLVRDFPYFARAVNVLVNFTVGPGLQFQSRIKGADGKLNKPLCQQVEDAFAFWADEADISGKLHFYDLMRLAKRQDVETGEFLLVKVKPNRRGRYLPFAVQAYEADWLTSRKDTYPLGVGATVGGNEPAIAQGIEYQQATGQVLAYWFTDPNGWGADVRIPAEDVIHGFDTLRPGQLRGVSPFAPAVLVAHSLRDFMGAELDAAKMAAKWLAFVEAPDIGAFQGLRTNADDTRIEDIENALIEYLRPGEKVTLSSHNRPGDAFDPFTRLILRMVAITVGISYELLTGDYQGLNYSVLRGIRNDLIKEFQPVQKRHERQFCRPIFRDLMDSMVLNSRVTLPDYWQNPYPFLAQQWMPSGMPPVDPLKEGRADADAIKSLLKSPQEIAASRGRDYEEVLDEIASAIAMQKERDLFVEPVTNSTKTNPAAINQDEADDETKSVKNIEKPILKAVAGLHRVTESLGARTDGQINSLQAQVGILAARETPAPSINVTVPERQTITDINVHIPKSGPVEKVVTERTPEGFAKRIVERELPDEESA